MPVNEQQRRVFQQVYDGLNPSQQKAVDAIEGPVLVIAGPGTGKTQILGARIAKILLDTDYAPQNILCLTYTDAGVVAMRRRLLSFIGADAYKVQLHTFHSFCNMVIQQNLSLFNKKELQDRCLLRNSPPHHPFFRHQTRGLVGGLPARKN
jgi:DNA helicase II / ATP-dependent DNA helicase PcrA